jgi:hypothetical protein
LDCAFFLSRLLLAFAVLQQNENRSFALEAEFLDYKKQ